MFIIINKNNMQSYPNNIENYQIISITGVDYVSLEEIIIKLNVMINNHLNNGAILIGGPSITQGRTLTDQLCFSASQAIVYPKKQQDVLDLLDINKKT